MPPAVATVFGGTGFIGRYVVKHLADAGVRIRVPTRRPQSGIFLKSMGEPGQIGLVRADIGDPGSVRAAVGNADAVVNLVGILYERGRQTFDAIHVEAARRIAEAARDRGAQRLVQVSALGADPKSPAAYARSKAAGEAAVLEAFPKASIVRPSIVFGTEDNFFNRFGAMAVFLPALPLIGGGRTRFQPVYVGDVAEAARRILDDPATAGRTYELGGPHVYTFRELMELLLEEIGRRRLLVPIPWAIAELQAAVLEKLPSPPLTRDQVMMLRRDNIVSESAQTLADLGIAPTSLEVILPTYLTRFRRGGRRA